jgi:2',3'-cyclic-nucleotide 2'-phosphodiesterase (5'-nucleotidase family)
MSPARAARRLAAVLTAATFGLAGLAVVAPTNAAAGGTAVTAPGDRADDRRGPQGPKNAGKKDQGKKSQGKKNQGKKSQGKGRYVDVQMLSFNDLHGNLQAPSGSSARLTTGYREGPDGAPVARTLEGTGGAERMATKLRQLRKGERHSFTVSPGDLVGASPLLSAAFHDEPTIESMNALGLDVSAVGNHEFDEGYQELQRLDEGGCLDDGAGEANQDSCPGGKRFAGADFDYLAANVFYAGTDETILPPYAIKRSGPVKVAFVGVVLEATPEIVTASGVAGLEFRDEVRTVNRLLPELERKGVNAVVVLLHEGGTPEPETFIASDGTETQVPASYDYTCGKGGELAAGSPVLDIAANLDAQVDAVLSSHTHQAYVCDVEDPRGNPRLVTQAASFGRLVTDHAMFYDVRRHDFVRRGAEAVNHPVTATLAKDRAQTAIVNRYTRLVEPISSRVLGSIGEDVTNVPDAQGESALGNLIADAQLADPSTVTGGEEPQIAFMNPGGIRASLTRDQQSSGEQVGEVTFGEAFAVQPFNNYLVSMSLTGAQLYDVLAEQVTGPNASNNKILQVSEGFSYERGPGGAVPGSVTLDGAPVLEDETYRVVVNSFLSDGGDGFATLGEGTGKYFGGLDIDAFADHLEATSPYTPGPLDRIR